MEFLNIQNSGTPFFAMLSTPACHGPWTDNTAPKYKNSFADRKAPRDPAFNQPAKVNILITTAYIYTFIWYMEKVMFSLVCVLPSQKAVHGITASFLESSVWVDES